MAKEPWEVDFEEKMCVLLNAMGRDNEPDFLNAMVQLKNFVQKERVLARINEDKAWSVYFKEVGNPEICQVFDAMVIKYCELLERF